MKKFYSQKILKYSLILIWAISIFWGLTNAQTRSCDLLWWWTLPHWESTTGYKIQEATYTQSCDANDWILTCNDGELFGGKNTYIYENCTPHTWADCNINGELVEHLDNIDLYSNSESTYDETCNQLRETFQCLDWNLTGSVDPTQYIYDTCFERRNLDCVNPREPEFVEHNDTLTVYTQEESNENFTCFDFQETLTCRNSEWEDNNWTSININNYFNSCDGLWIKWCNWTGLDINDEPIPLFLPNLGTWFFYSASYHNINCDNIKTELSCNDGTILWGNPNYYQYIQCIQASDCVGMWNGWTIKHNQTVSWYLEESTSWECESIQLTCLDGTINWDYEAYQFKNCNDSAKDCIQERSGDILVDGWAGWDIIHWESVVWYRYETSPWPNNCNNYSSTLTCNNGNIYWGNPDYYQYSECTNGDGQECEITWIDQNGSIIDAVIQHGDNRILYQTTWTNYPVLCETQNTTISCENGNLIWWNNDYYKYNYCIDGEYIPDGQWPLDNENLIEWLDLELSNISVRNGNEVVELTNPYITLTIKNNWTEHANTAWTPLGDGFIKCRLGNELVYQSSLIETFVVWSNTIEQIDNLRLSNRATQNVWENTIECEIWGNVWSESDVNLDNNIFSVTIKVISKPKGRFDISMSKSIDPIQQNLDPAELTIWAEWVKNFALKKIMDILIPLVIALWLVVIILWFYRIMFDESEDSTSIWIKYIIYGVVGILLMMSAKYIWSTLYEDIFQSWNITAITGVDMSQTLYEKVVYPFLKIFVYLILGAMFIILAGRVVSFTLSPSEEIKKKSITIIVWNVISMIIILWAKQIVEAVYGKKEQVLNQNAQTLADIGTGVLSDKNIPIIYNVINWVLWLASFIVLVLIILQTIQLLTNPDNPDQLNKIKKNILYIFIWIFIIWIGYVITNFVIIN